MRHLIIAALIITFSSQVFADSKSEKIEELMKAMGLMDTWKQQIEQGKEYNRKIAPQLMDRIISRLNPDEDFKKRFKATADNFIKKVETPWSAEKIVSVWADYYGPEFTEEELDQLISFYTSPLGQKDIRVTRASLTKFSKYFQEAGQPIFEKAMAEYIEELKTVADKCNCAKQVAQPRSVGRRKATR